jgi:hypothetical protein
VQLETKHLHMSWQLCCHSSRHTACHTACHAEGVEQSPSLELPDEVMKQLQEEAVVMSRMRHPNLVSFMVRAK